VLGELYDIAMRRKSSKHTIGSEEITWNKKEGGISKWVLKVTEGLRGVSEKRPPSGEEHK